MEQSAWPAEEANVDALGGVINQTIPSKPASPALKNGSDLRESGYLIAVGSKSARFRRKHKSKMIVVFLAIAIIFLLSLATAMTVLYVKCKKHKGIKICETRECLRSAAKLAVSMDPTIDPCEDFYQYVCGNWAEDHPRPDAYRSYDWFRDKQTRVFNLVRDFLAQNLTDKPLPVRQAKDMYTACMDVETLDKTGVSPILTVLSSLGLPPYPTLLNVTDDIDYSAYNFDWIDVVIKVKTQLAMDVLIGFDIFTDPKNSSIYRLVLGSPETRNPFPSIPLDSIRRNHMKRTLINRRRGNFLNIFNLQDDVNHSKETDDNKEKEERNKRLHKIYYGELIKAIFIASDGPNKLKMSEPELDSNILDTVETYINIYNDLYELEQVEKNETEVELETDFKIPEYTVDELQAHTDSIVEFNNLTASNIWQRYLEGVFSISNTVINFEEEKVLVSDPDLKYLSLMAALVQNLSPASLELYIWVQVVEVMAIHTTSELRSLHQRYYDQLRGDKEETAGGSPSRSLVCADAVNDMLGMAVSYSIVDHTFVNLTKPKIENMIKNMKDTLAVLVMKAAWMDSETKLATYHKIDRMRSLIGFPDWLLESGKLDEYYKGIKIEQDTHLNNLINVVQVRLKNGLNKFRNLNNFTWATDPTEVNAYHTFQENTITIPLVMMQYPFYDLGLESLNYGALGTILGHEITHGFDNIGRQFDKDGNMLQWWSNTTIQAFINKTKCFIKQYSSYYLHAIDEYVNGERTLGENIADNGGLREAFGAYRMFAKTKPPEPKLPGFETFSQEQMFFLSYGNLWCGVTTKGALAASMRDEHSPYFIRARAALANTPEFAAAFRCKTNSTMNPVNKCFIF